MKDDSNVTYFINSGFYKVDENYKILKNQNYEISGIDSNNSVDFIKVSNYYDGLYLVEYDYDNYEELPYGEIKSLLPSKLADELEKIKTVDDILSFGEKINVEPDVYGRSYVFDIGIPLKIKQTTTLGGYKTNDLIVLARFRAGFYCEDNLNINDSYVHMEIYTNWNPIVLMDDFKSIPKLSEFGNVDYTGDYYGDGTCLNQSNQGTIITDALSGGTYCNFSHYYGSVDYSIVQYFVDQKGEVKLEIENTVNDMDEYIAKDNKNLNYKITISNTGDATSGNNIIETSVPEEIIVKEESISDDGIYDKRDNSITWRIDSLDAGEKYTFTYSATVSDKADKSKTYVGKTKVFSNQSKVVHAKETKVYLSKSSELIDRNNLVNPNTYSTAVFGIVTVVLICLVISTYLVKYRKNNN